MPTKLCKRTRYPCRGSTTKDMAYHQSHPGNLGHLSYCEDTILTCQHEGIKMPDSKRVEAQGEQTPGTLLLELSDSADRPGSIILALEVRNSTSFEKTTYVSILHIWIGSARRSRRSLVDNLKSQGVPQPSLESTLIV